MPLAVSSTLQRHLKTKDGAWAKVKQGLGASSAKRSAIGSSRWSWSGRTRMGIVGGLVP
jgi:hypothetical protein